MRYTEHIQKALDHIGEHLGGECTLEHTDYEKGVSP